MGTECECATWARGNAATVLICEHHPNCPQYNPEQNTRDLLMRLLDGIETWANDEDGIHSDCWGAYVDACCAVGHYTRPAKKESINKKENGKHRLLN